LIFIKEYFSHFSDTTAKIITVADLNKTDGETP
jgi:hypothetical protein